MRTYILYVSFFIAVLSWFRMSNYLRRKGIKTLKYFPGSPILVYEYMIFTRRESDRFGIWSYIFISSIVYAGILFIFEFL